ncbi:NUDIX domain-containing protein [Kitasatospora sp. NPDC057738]|uniref:NUDIX domain-containing protein n=1 Tax=Kitasatospora sp. NPDC057738 TaxID=3346233 RepID=UPI0036A30716
MHTRVTGIAVRGGRMLLLNQDTEGPRRWSLPGGKVEDGETLAGALRREMVEETGLEVEVGCLLYVCDVTAAGVVHITFEVAVTGARIGDVAAGADTRPIRGVEWVKLDDLPAHGFSERFVKLARADWPGAGTYMGPKSNIGL